MPATAVTAANITCYPTANKEREINMAAKSAAATPTPYTSTPCKRYKYLGESWLCTGMHTWLDRDDGGPDGEWEDGRMGARVEIKRYEHGGCDDCDSVDYRDMATKKKTVADMRRRRMNEVVKEKKEKKKEDDDASSVR